MSHLKTILCYFFNATLSALSHFQNRFNSRFWILWVYYMMSLWYPPLHLSWVLILSDTSSDNNTIIWDNDDIMFNNYDVYKKNMCMFGYTLLQIIYFSVLVTAIVFKMKHEIITLIILFSYIIYKYNCNQFLCLKKWILAYYDRLWGYLLPASFFFLII